MLGVTAVALGSYAAYASNSATMTVTATIAHDVSLSVTQDLDLGTITINPAYTGETNWNYNWDSGAIYYLNQGAIVSADNATVGTFTANIPNPSACSRGEYSCGGLSVVGNGPFALNDFFGGSGESTYCTFMIHYSESENTFKLSPDECYIGDVSKVTTGAHSGTLTISYNPE